MIRRAFVCVAVATIAVLLTTGVASAHANLASSDPANGATLATAPSQIRLTFTEPPDPSLSTIQVLDAGGTLLQTGAVALEPPRTLSASMRADMPDGVYTVSWRTVSTMDGHVTAGAFAFGVGKISGPITPGASTTGASSSGPTLLSVTAKTALYAGLMLLVAAPVVGLWLFRREPGALRVVGVTGALIAFGGAIGMLLSEQHTVGVSIDDLLRTTTGRPYGWLVVATLAAAICTLIAAARARWLPALWGGGAAAAVAMAVRTASGHAASAPDALLQQGFGWLHFLAAGLWIGGLVLLLLLLRERLRGSKVPPSAEARRFSNLALAAVSVVAVTGALRAVSELGGLSNVLDGLHRAYGITLVAKVAVALVLIALGATNRLRNVILVAENPRPLRTFVAAETVFALGVLVLTGALTGLNPPASLATAQPGPAPVAGTATGADFATTTRVSLTAAPGSPGPNAFDAAVTDYNTGAVLPADAVSLRFLSVTHPELPASQLRLTQQSDGGWTGQGIAMSVAGTWRVTTLIRSGATTTEVPLTLITVNGGSTSTVAIAGAPTTTTTSFPDGVSLQSFVEQATAGPNPVHVTAFGPDGNELPLRTAAIVVNPTNGEPIRPPLQRFSAGHLVANTTLDAGDYLIDIVATARSGETYQSTWPLTIAPAAAGSASAG